MIVTYVQRFQDTGNLCKEEAVSGTVWSLVIETFSLPVNPGPHSPKILPTSGALPSSPHAAEQLVQAAGKACGLWLHTRPFG